MSKLKIKKGDEVIVTRGKNRGARGKVLKVHPSENSAIVERINMVKRHTRPNPSKQVQGGIVEREAPIQLSNLALADPKDGKPTRVGFKILDDGRKVRFAKRSGDVIDG